MTLFTFQGVEADCTHHNGKFNTGGFPMQGTVTDDTLRYHNKEFKLRLNNGVVDPLVVSTTMTKFQDKSKTSLQVAFNLDLEGNGRPSKLRAYKIIFSDNSIDRYTMPPGDETCTVNIFRTGKDVNSIIAFT